MSTTAESFDSVARLIEIGRLGDAKRLLGQAIAHEPENPRGELLAGHIALLEGNTAAAETYASAALARDPHNLATGELLYEILAQQKRWAEAERIVIELIRAHPTDADLFASYCHLMLCTLHVDKASELSKEALRLDPQNDRARLMGVLVGLVRGDASTQYQVEKLVSEDPESRWVVTLLFTSLVDQKRFEEALRVGQQLLRANPNNTALTEALVELRMQTHWIAAPARPLARWGWFGAAALWVLALVTIRLASALQSTVALWLAGAYLAYCLYTWIYPPLLRRWIRHRGIVP
ncbi:MAG: tetratricopeptide repeat protein [Thermoanaerobaculia bacterium]|nr:tetratricopeptide repeat protein [Thermoanaerobaculia bacterium]